MEKRFYDKKIAGTTGEMTLTGKEKVNSVIKTAFVGEEYSGYLKIKNFMQTMPTRRITHQGEDALVIKFCEAKTVDQLTNLDDPKSLESFKEFFADLTIMWDRTAQPFDENQLTRNYAKIALDVLPKFQQFAIERLGVSLDDELYLGDINVGSLKNFFSLQKDGFEKVPPRIVLSHGDENLTNLLVPNNPDDGKYKVIDARFAGYYDPAWVLGNIFGRTYLFNAVYPLTNVSNKRVGRRVYFVNPLPTQSSTTQQIKEIVVDYISEKEREDPTLGLRAAAYIANNIGRSIAFLRDKSFTKTCEDYGISHLLTAMYEVK